MSYRLEKSSLSLTYRNKYIVMIPFRDFFPIHKLLNRCINFDMKPISLSNILNVLYSIDYWLSIPTNYGNVYIECNM